MAVAKKRRQCRCKPKVKKVLGTGLMLSILLAFLGALVISITAEMKAESERRLIKIERVVGIENANLLEFWKYLDDGKLRKY